MLLSKDLVGFYQISHETLVDQRQEIVSLRAERDALKAENATLKINFDWLRMKVNQLERERAQLIEKAYNITLPAPELTRHVAADVPDAFSFEDIGDDLAKRLGMPIFGHQQPHQDA